MPASQVTSEVAKTLRLDRECGPWRAKMQLVSQRRNSSDHKEDVSANLLHLQHLSAVKLSGLLNGSWGRSR